jgi:RNA polymerase sigma factor (sigma-70 family)
MDTPSTIYPYPCWHPAATPRDWPSVFARVSLGDFELTPALDADLSAQALRAQNVALARDELFVRLSGKIMRFAARFDSWDIAPFDADDVRQECYLVYLETVRRWRPIDPVVPSGFGAWFLRVFPLWLAHRVARLRGSRRAQTTPLSAAHAEQPDAAAGMVDSELTHAVFELCARVSASDCRIVRLRVAGLPAHAVADRLGISRRTVQRSLARVVRLTRVEWHERDAG